MANENLSCLFNLCEVIEFVNIEIKSISKSFKFLNKKETLFWENRVCDLFDLFAPHDFMHNKFHIIVQRCFILSSGAAFVTEKENRPPNKKINCFFCYFKLLLYGIK